MASITIEDVRRSLIKYTPYFGGLSYSALAFNSMGIHFPFLDKTGQLIMFNSTLCLSHIGFGVYIYNRPINDVLKPSRSRRVVWSIFGSWIMNLGSVLCWAIVKEIGPKNKLARALIGLTGGCVFLYIATDYLCAIDKLRAQDFPDDDRDSGNEDDEDDAA
ncbi:uncharacterized protein LOC116302179 [Actinia tenebrosa]|uniref:Uncharacterized protein LOC116302179 n=1 Tax=Actinia tenebrosa TaxID=6105 RepID=A0A6P8IKE6_ACTTE|nr:uncharacterized protein LOC116302179 [Actinia tenebrosa]